MKKILLCLCIYIALPSISQSPLKMEDIMAGNEFIGHQPYLIKWAPNNQSVYFRWNHTNDIIAPYYQTKISDPNPEELALSAYESLPLDGTISNHDRQATHFFKNGSNLYQWDSLKTLPIFKQSQNYAIQNIISDHIIIIREGNRLIEWNRSTGTYFEILNFNDGWMPTEEPESNNYLERQQLELFDFIDLKNQRQDALTVFSDADKTKKIPEFFLEGKTLGLLALNTQRSTVIFRTDDASKPTNTHIEKYVTHSGHTEIQNARAKVGKPLGKHDLYTMDLSSGDFIKVEIEHLPGIKYKPKYLGLYQSSFKPKYSEPKSVFYTQVLFNKTGNLALVELKSYDNKDRWICILDSKTGHLDCIDHQHNEAWIGGPGISGWNGVPGNIGWIPNQDAVYFQSEKTGYSHLYIHALNDKKPTQLTNGLFEIYQAKISKDGETFYITANKTHPGNRGFYHFNIASKKWSPIFENDGHYEVHISPNEAHLAIRYSYKNKPWELYLAPNKPNSVLTQVTHSTTEKFKTYHWRKPEVVQLVNEEKTNIYARIYRPEKSKKNGAAIQFVHGAGYLQNAHNWWSGYYREYMFHNLLCDLGYTVLDIDYRASKGYGRDFRTAIYRHMGGADLKDQLIGRSYLIDQEKIDPEKVGIYGGSYGGFITIMALLTEPGKFKCGAAIRSVTDWAHYNHEYTSNILNTPETDSIAFRQSSPIYFADKLEDELLILHGMVDNNVQFQDVVRLNQRFIELGKKSFTMALYPVEPHGFVQTSSWVDEYTRILDLFNRTLVKPN